ncbi:hypothetical protein HGRIS_001943 [Hohenbuehelia grisea]|uniref:Uncharacterized protein n=1 Tax=Hohenbuehelia grisea TaxID=104357 RepID=A0ABR3JJ21_9AGAR
MDVDWMQDSPRLAKGPVALPVFNSFFVYIHIIPPLPCRLPAQMQSPSRYYRSAVPELPKSRFQNSSTWQYSLQKNSARAAEVPSQPRARCSLGDHGQGVARREKEGGTKSGT